MRADQTGALKSQKAQVCSFRGIGGTFSLLSLFSMALLELGILVEESEEESEEAT